MRPVETQINVIMPDTEGFPNGDDYDEMINGESAEKQVRMQGNADAGVVHVQKQGSGMLPLLNDGTKREMEDTSSLHGGLPLQGTNGEQQQCPYVPEGGEERNEDFLVSRKQESPLKASPQKIDGIREIDIKVECENAHEDPHRVAPQSRAVSHIWLEKISDASERLPLKSRQQPRKLIPGAKGWVEQQNESQMAPIPQQLNSPLEIWQLARMVGCGGALGQTVVKDALKAALKGWIRGCRKASSIDSEAVRGLNDVFSMLGQNHALVHPQMGQSTGSRQLGPSHPQRCCEFAVQI